MSIPGMPGIPGLSIDGCFAPGAFKARVKVSERRRRSNLAIYTC